MRPVEPESEFVIKIHDINDNEPTFPEEIYTASVPEMSVVGEFIYNVYGGIKKIQKNSYQEILRILWSINWSHLNLGNLWFPKGTYLILWIKNESEKRLMHFSPPMG